MSSVLRNAGRLCILFLFALAPVFAQEQEGYDVRLAILSYKGSGDWYNSKEGVANLMRALEKDTQGRITANPRPIELTATDKNLFRYPILYINGHGNHEEGAILFDKDDAEALRAYVRAGGFIFVNDDYGLDRAFRAAITNVFTNALVPLPNTHEIYHVFHTMEGGLPKIHEHDGEPAQGYGIYVAGRLVLFYAYSADIGDGWADERVHGNPKEIREKALRMGVNIIIYALTR